MKYTYDEFDRITGLRYDDETSDRYTYEYGANGMAARVHDNNLGRSYETEYDLSDRPCQGTLIGADGHRLYRTTLEYTRHSNLNSFREEVGEGWLGSTHKTSYTYDIDNRVTEMQFDDATHKIAYEYDELGRIKERALTNGSAGYTLPTPSWPVAMARQHHAAGGRHHAGHGQQRDELRLRLRFPREHHLGDAQRQGDHLHLRRPLASSSG